VSLKFVASFAKSNRRSFDSANRKKRGLRRSGWQFYLCCELQTQDTRVCAQPGWCIGLSALWGLSVLYLGLWPRLVYVAPLAL